MKADKDALKTMGEVILHLGRRTFFCEIEFEDPEIYRNTFKLLRCVDSQVALVLKNLLANAGDRRDMISIPGLGRCPGGGHGNSLQNSCLENAMDRGAWQATVHRVTKSRT